MSKNGAQQRTKKHAELLIGGHFLLWSFFRASLREFEQKSKNLPAPTPMLLSGNHKTKHRSRLIP